MPRLIFLLLMFFTLQSYAESKTVLSSILPQAHVDKPAVWQDQLGGFATGGGAHVRNPVKNLKLLHMDLPYLRGGCGGIDLFGGGFGYINKEQLEGLIKNIGNSAKSYAVMLTVRTLSPMIGDLLEYLESIARSINAQNINSCQMGASIASGLFPKNEASQDLACSARKMGDPKSVGSHLSNYFTARYDCQNREEKEKTVNEDKNFLGTEFNLVWKALSKTQSSEEGIDFNIYKEFLMSLSGTLIATKKGDTTAFEHLPSLLNSGELLKAAIFGSDGLNLQLYQCKETQNCLEVTKVESKNDTSMINHVKKLLDSIEEKIAKENLQQTVALTAEEKHLVSTTSIPIIKVITLESALKGHGVSTSIQDMAEVIAYDYVTNYLNSLLGFVYRALSNLEYAQNESDKIIFFKKEIKDIKQLLYQEKVSAYQRLNTLLSVKIKSQSIEDTVRTHFIELRS